MHICSPGTESIDTIIEGFFDKDTSRGCLHTHKQVGFLLQEKYLLLMVCIGSPLTSCGSLLCQQNQACIAWHLMLLLHALALSRIMHKNATLYQFITQRYASTMLLNFYTSDWITCPLFNLYQFSLIIYTSTTSSILHFARHTKVQNKL